MNQSTQSIGHTSLSIFQYVLVISACVLICSMCCVYLALGHVEVLPGQVLLLSFAALAVINYMYSSDVLYPAFMFSVIWDLAVGIYQIFPSEIDSIRWPTAVILLVGAVSFSAGCALGTRPICAGSPWFAEDVSRSLFRTLLVVGCLIVVPFSVYATMKLAGMYNLSAAMFIAARQAVVDLQTEDMAVSKNVLLAMAPTVAVSTAFILILDEKRTWIVTTGICTTLVLGLLTTGRIILLLLLCGWVVLRLFRLPSRSFFRVGRKMIMSGALIVLLMTLVPLLTKSETQSGGSGRHSGAYIAATMTETYIAGPMAGFNYIVENPGTFRDQSNNTFAQVLSPLRVVGLHYVPPPNFDPFMPVPFPINVFTAYKSFYIDFGALGCCLAWFLCGCLSGLVFFAADKGNRFARFVYCYLVYAILFSIFQNSFILLYRYAYVLLFGAVYFIVIPRLPRIALVAKFQSI